MYTPLSTMFQLYRGARFFFGEGNCSTGEDHLPVASHWQTLSHNVVSSTPRHERDSNSQLKRRMNGTLRPKTSDYDTHHSPSCCLPCYTTALNPEGIPYPPTVDDLICFGFSSQW
jgi:hypothetical protein